MWRGPCLPHPTHLFPIFHLVLYSSPSLPLISSLNTPSLFPPYSPSTVFLPLGMLFHPSLPYLITCQSHFHLHVISLKIPSPTIQSKQDPSHTLSHPFIFIVSFDILMFYSSIWFIIVILAPTSMSDNSRCSVNVCNERNNEWMNGSTGRKGDTGKSS